MSSSRQGGTDAVWCVTVSTINRERPGHDVQTTRPGAGAKRARKQGGKHAARYSFQSPGNQGSISEARPEGLDSDAAGLRQVHAEMVSLQGMISYPIAIIFRQGFHM